MQPLTENLTIMDLFSGCGGLSLGFEEAGYTPLLAIDNWEDALKTYRYNREGVSTLCADLSTLDPEKVKMAYDIQNLDVIIGGPPCQGFSVAGKRIIEDERNSLYKSFVGFVKSFRPKAFVMENVPQILTVGDGIIRKSIINDFSDLGYKVNYKVIISSDFGVPQNRRRAVFVGLLNKSYDFNLTQVQHKVTSREALADLPDRTLNNGAPYPCPPLSEYQTLIRKDSSGVYNHEITEHNQKTKDIISKVPDGGNYKDLPKELQQTRKVHIAWTRLNSQKPSFTIDCGHNHHFHYEYNRVPTVRESARIQSFPDRFIFLGTKGSQLRQVGNAVPPLLAKAIAESLKPYLYV